MEIQAVFIRSQPARANSSEQQAAAGAGVFAPFKGLGFWASVPQDTEWPVCAHLTSCAVGGE